MPVQAQARHSLTQSVPRPVAQPPHPLRLHVQARPRALTRHSQPDDRGDVLGAGPQATFMACTPFPAARGIPLWYGVKPTERQAQRIAELGVGWIPISTSADYIRDGVAVIRRAFEKAGRDPAALEVSLFGAPADPDVLRKAREAGVTRAILGLAPEPPDKVLPVLDRHASLVQSVA